MFEHALTARARELAAIGRYEQAAKCFEQVGECAAAVHCYRKAGMLASAARCLELFGRFDDAEQCYRAIGDEVSARRVRKVANKILRPYSTPWYEQEDLPCVDESEYQKKGTFEKRNKKPKHHSAPKLKAPSGKWACKECKLTFTTPHEARRHCRDKHPLGYDDCVSRMAARRSADDDCEVTIRRRNEIGEIQSLMCNNGRTRPRHSHYTRPYGYFINAQPDGLDRRSY